VNADNKLSMTIAVHTIKEVNHLDYYNYQDYDHFKWLIILIGRCFVTVQNFATIMNNKNDNTNPPAINLVLTTEPPFPDSNAARIQMTTTNQNPSQAAVTAGLTTNSSFSMATSSAAVGHNSLSPTTSKKNEPLFLPILLWVVVALKRDRKKGRKNTKMQAEQLKEKRYKTANVEMAKFLSNDDSLVDNNPLPTDDNDEDDADDDFPTIPHAHV
jgi:hypothetical protein